MRSNKIQIQRNTNDSETQNNLLNVRTCTIYSVRLKLRHKMQYSNVRAYCQRNLVCLYDYRLFDDVRNYTHKLIFYRNLTSFPFFPVRFEGCSLITRAAPDYPN